QSPGLPVFRHRSSAKYYSNPGGESGERTLEYCASIRTAAGDGLLYEHTGHGRFNRLVLSGEPQRTREFDTHNVDDAGRQPELLPEPLREKLASKHTHRHRPPSAFGRWSVPNFRADWPGYPAV